MKNIVRNNYLIATSQPYYKRLVADLSSRLNTKFYIVESDIELNRSLLQDLKPKMIFFPHWSYKIPQEFYNNYECVIFHMTDLPFGRGGSPLQNLISRGIYKTKISALKCIEELDAGPIYLKRDLSLAEGSAREIFEKCVSIISTMIEEIVIQDIQPQPQKGDIVNFKRRTPTQSELSSVDSIQKLHDHIRMLDAPGYPHAYFENEHFRFELTDSKIVDGDVVATLRAKSKNAKSKK
jgi:methionyl-tRNA formyltransferase